MSQPMGQSWRVVGASVTGVSHERADLGCQDAHGWRPLRDVGLALAVADGAGSARFGQTGAAVAVQAALNSIACTADNVRDCALEDIRRSVADALEAAIEAVEAEAHRSGVEARDLATTLIVVAAGTCGAAAAQVGDGAAVLATADGALVSLTRPHIGEYANETIFLTSPGALDAAQIVSHCAPAAHLAVFSDGLQRLALTLPEGAPHAPFFAPLFRFAAEKADLGAAQQQLEAFLKSPRITERVDDDLTLVLATRVW